MAPTIIGFDGLTRTAKNPKWSRATGEMRVEVWQGPIGRAQTQYDLLKALADDVEDLDLQRGGGLGTLTITYIDDASDQQTTEENNTIWEIIGQDFRKNIRAFGATGEFKAKKAFNKDSDQADLDKARTFHETGRQVGEIPTTDPALTYFKLLERGQDEYVRSTAIIRKSILVGKRSLLTASWKGVDRAWKLDGETGSPDISTTGPASSIGAVNQMPEEDGTKKQWLKRQPTIGFPSVGRYSIVQEWWYAARWSHNMYLGDEEDGNP